MRKSVRGQIEMRNRTKDFYICGRRLIVALAFTILTSAPTLAADAPAFAFNLVRSAALPATCLVNARGNTLIQPAGPVEVLTIKVQGLPPKTDFDFFVIQVPKAPFGMSWYQGDIETNRKGVGLGTFVGRFSIETFVVAPGSTAAPQTFNHAFPSASTNPATNPIQMYHLGLWFNSPKDAQKAGCPGTVTPFNGEHDAGVQVLNTSNFPDLKGPLIKVK